MDVLIYPSLKIITGANETQEGGGGVGGGRESGLDLKTRTTTSWRFNLKVFSRIVEKYSTRKASLYYCSPEILVR